MLNENICRAHQPEICLVDNNMAVVNALPRTLERGMTLVEIMIVLAIMASVMGIVGVFASGAMTNSRIKEAQVEIGNLKQAVDSFWVMRQEYPDSLSQLADPPSGMAPIMERLPEDPWGNDYQYSRERDGFKIYSTGPDGSSGGSDDVCAEGDECS